MAAAINFFVPALAFTPINNLSGSGLGFYGSAGFGASVAVGSFQDNTYVTNSNGTAQGPQTNNFKYINASSGYLNGATSGLHLRQIPNYQSTVQVRFTYDTGVKVQNAKARIYDRTNINNAATGVLCYVADIWHSDTVQNMNGSGASTWSALAGSSVVLTFANASPGVSGLAPSGTNTVSDTHDWWMVLSASPNSVGSKTQFGLYVELEYL